MTLSIDGRHILNPAAPGFGTLLRHWRELRGLSMKRLAALSGLDYSSVSRFESGTRKPERETVIALADALQLTGAHRAVFLSVAGFIESPLTDAQASYLCGWSDRFTRRYSD
jgi:transcriptional regulator with XRE-family HTH domain